MSVELTRRDEMVVVTIDRPEALNALSAKVLAGIERAFDAAEALGRRREARALIVTGSGQKAFCAGADISEFQGRNLSETRAGSRYGQLLFARLDRFPIASIAAINGYAFGGGLELALACSFRIATPNAKMGLPEIKLGVVPGYGGTQRLPRLVGEARALEIIMTGRTVAAEEAFRIGLVNRLVEGDAVEAAIAFAREFTCYSLPVLGFSRDAVKRAGDTPFDEGLEAEADLSTLAFMTADSSEGAAAFLEKRKANFKDA